jgi:hypothetical protein
VSWLRDLVVSRQVKDCIATLDIISADFDAELAWSSLKPLIANAIRQNGKLVRSKMLRDGVLPRDIVLTLAANIALKSLGSGEHHTYRGKLSMVGSSYRVIFSTIVSQQTILGTITEDERNNALSNMADIVAEAG